MSTPSESKPKSKTGMARIWAAFFYSLHGLGFAISNSSAFRQELIAAILLSGLLPFLPLSLLWKGLLLFSTWSILVAELLNTAVECAIDLVTSEYHILAKRSKDLGSAAVLINIIVTAILWGCAIFLILNPSSSG